MHDDDQAIRMLLERRGLLRGAAMLGAGAMAMSPLPALAASSQSAAIRKAAEAGKEASLKRLRDWIALPSIAAENRNMPEGAAYMAELAK
ncbi:MAG: twin-arginine translocation pathway signal protein, partial [Sphingopyxis sp.]|nr:twin-arginine translocation pathway signal protein [Sphingopyxis sp.]